MFAEKTNHTDTSEINQNIHCSNFMEINQVEQQLCQIALYHDRRKSKSLD